MFEDDTPAAAAAVVADVNDDAVDQMLLSTPINDALCVCELTDDDDAARGNIGDDGGDDCCCSCCDGYAAMRGERSPAK